MAAMNRDHRTEQAIHEGIIPPRYGKVQASGEEDVGKSINALKSFNKLHQYLSKPKLEKALKNIEIYKNNPNFSRQLAKYLHTKLDK